MANMGQRGLSPLARFLGRGVPMGLRERWRELWNRPEELEPARKLELASGYNVRELGGYAVEQGVTSYRRFVRSGGLDMLSAQDQRRLYDYGVRLVLDLRGNHEVSVAADKIQQMPGVRFCHVPLFDIDLSDPSLGSDELGGSYHTLGYLTMLANREAVRKAFLFFATAKEGECVLFHCAAGMDRTGMMAMLLLGLVGASNERIVADYCYSFGSCAEVDGIVYKGKRPVRRELELRLDAITTVLDRLEEGYGTIERYLLSCGVEQRALERVRGHLL